MGKIFINEETLEKIANSIRLMNGETDKYKPSEMASKIHSGGKYRPRYLSFRQCNDKNNDFKLEQIDTSRMTNMSDMFSRITVDTEIDVSNFDTSKVTNMSYMFSGSKNLVLKLPAIKNWNVSSVEQMDYMFANFGRTINFDFSNWDLSNVIFLYDMFLNCSDITDESIKSILVMLKTVAKISERHKNLKDVGVIRDQISKWTSFTEWNDLANLGWTTGYEISPDDKFKIYYYFKNTDGIDISNLSAEIGIYKIADFVDNSSIYAKFIPQISSLKSEWAGNVNLDDVTISSTDFSAIYKAVENLEPDSTIEVAGTEKANVDVPLGIYFLNVNNLSGVEGLTLNYGEHVAILTNRECKNWGYTPISYSKDYYIDNQSYIYSEISNGTKISI